MKRNLIALMIAALLCPVALVAQEQEKLYGDIKTQSSQPEWIKNAVIYEVNLRQGTPERNLRGMQLQLPRLKDLGVDILWLMPVHPISEKNRKGELGSYYAVKDYKDINPEFGNIDDFKEFVRTAHSLGMKVILDEVCNHSGTDNAWVEEHPDFYAKDKDGKFISPYDWTDVYKFDYSNPEMRKAMDDALLFWVREADIDGYRFDVAFEVPTDYWENIRAQINEVKPVFFLAEASKPELTVKAFDSDYNWPMKDLFNAIAATQGVNEYAKKENQKLPKASAKDIITLVEKQKAQYPKGAINMNMITNHDLNSWEGTEFDRLGPATGAFAVLSYTLPGVPMIYTGQEVGFNHAFEFFVQDSVVPDYSANEFTAFYEMLNSLKHNHKALDAGIGGGDFRSLGSDNENVIAFERAKLENKIVVIANLSGKEVAPALKEIPAIEGMKNYFSGKDAFIPEKLAPWEYLVFTVF